MARCRRLRGAGREPEQDAALHVTDAIADVRRDGDGAARTVLGHYRTCFPEVFDERSGAFAPPHRAFVGGEDACLPLVEGIDSQRSGLARVRILGSRIRL